MLHGHGDDGYRCARALRANFSANVRPGGMPATLCAHLGSQLDRAGTYPEVAAETLTELLARHHGVTPTQILVTNGAIAGIYLVADAWRGKRSVVVGPTFAEYADAAQLAHHEVAWISREDFTAGRFVGAALVWLCNPNNPTGEVFSRDSLLCVIDQHPAVTFVVDLAYADFCAEAALCAADTTTRSNLVLIHSLTKNFGVPGLRLGYLAAAESTLKLVARLVAPWSVNALALAAGEFCLRHPAEVALPRDTLLAETARMRVAIPAESGLRPLPTSATFFLVELAHGTSAQLKSWLVHEHGLLVRDAANFFWLNQRFVRVATQTAEQNQWLIEALHVWKP